MPDLTQERLRELSEIAARWWVWVPGTQRTDERGQARIRTMRVGAHGINPDTMARIPDLSDPATAGLLPFVLRKATGIETLHATCEEFSGAKFSGATKWYLSDVHDQVAKEEPTELEALVLGGDALVRARESEPRATPYDAPGANPLDILDGAEPAEEGEG